MGQQGRGRRNGRVESKGSVARMEEKGKYLKETLKREHMIMQLIDDDYYLIL